MPNWKKKKLKEEATDADAALGAVSLRCLRRRRRRRSRFHIAIIRPSQVNQKRICGCPPQLPELPVPTYRVSQQEVGFEFFALDWKYRPFERSVVS